MSKKITGINFDKRSKTWIIDKKVKGERIFERTTFSQSEYELAVQHYLKLVDDVSKKHNGAKFFRDVAVKYCVENEAKRTIKNDVRLLEIICDGYIGDMPIDRIHKDCEGIKKLVNDLKSGKRKNKTINAYIELVRRVLNKCAHVWRDEGNMPYLLSPPKLPLLPLDDRRSPYPISWDEQAALMRELPKDKAEMMLAYINTGARERELCALQWSWEVKVKKGLAFIIPADVVKGGTVGERLLVCNDIATSVINAQRGKHETHVFSYEGKPLRNMRTSAWVKARARAGLNDLHVHDLRHTFAHRLRKAGIDQQTRRELLGHSCSDITEHYSMADIELLYKAANAITKPMHGESIVKLNRRKLVAVR